MADNYAFVTVGTTRFDALVSAILSPDFAAACQKHSVSRVRVQVGSSALPVGVDVPDAGKETRWSISPPGLSPVTFEFFTLRPSLAEDIAGASFIVSHAGAGSIFEALRAEKPLIVVVNDALADNHQTELADAMSKRGYCKSCTPTSLASSLADASFTRRERLPSAAPGLAAFVAGVDAVCGF